MGKGTANTDFKAHTKFNLVGTGFIILIVYLSVFASASYDIILLWDYIINET